MRYLQLLALLCLFACQQPVTRTWKNDFSETLPLLGHRNWIVVSDKAFPQQNTPGIVYINTNDSLLPVLQYVMQELKAAGHVKPVIYQDKELAFLTDNDAPGVKKLSGDVAALLQGQPVNTLLHDSVFAKLDATAGLFKVVVLKTNELVPYSSVLLQLDCAYWNPEKEAALRAKMATDK